ncbi:zf-HC2 domain-containing protein [Streptomyces sp. NPDC006368]|uniref:anti-sigma factor family protein n=1 Tax=Streptomyces sp. NPDC006368 TaxID=3156760 RepID=UPI0033A00699
MSGTGPTPAEQHLGDRLAALVDGELGHDARERVLAHLATCARCKAEADAQRRVKSVFAQAAPPPPSEGLLARLQGLPGGAPGARGDDDQDPGRPFGRSGPFDDRGFGGGHFDDRRFDDGGVFAVKHDGFALPGGPGSGFRIHEVGRPGTAERSPWRGRRFAFAAASAVSFAAIALGGALPTAANVDARGEGGNNVTPLRTSGQTPNAAADRRRGLGTGTGTGSASPLPVVRAQGRQPAAHPFLSATSLSGAAPLSPLLVRPTVSAFHFATAPGPAAAPGPAPGASVAPSPSVLPFTGRR